MGPFLSNEIIAQRPIYKRAISTQMTCNSRENQLLCQRRWAGASHPQLPFIHQGFLWNARSSSEEEFENQWPRKPSEVSSSSPNITDLSGSFEGRMTNSERSLLIFTKPLPLLPSFSDVKTEARRRPGACQTSHTVTSCRGGSGPTWLSPSPHTQP